MSTTATVPDAGPASVDEQDETYVPLYSDIRKIADVLRHVPSHVPSVNELAGTVGAIIAFIEHGDSIVKVARDADVTQQADQDKVVRVLTQNEPPPVAGDVQTNAAQARLNQAQENRIADLEATIAALAAQVHATAAINAAGASPVTEPAPAPQAYDATQAPFVNPVDAPDAPPVATSPTAPLEGVQASAGFTIPTSRPLAGAPQPTAPPAVPYVDPAPAAPASTTTDQEGAA